jgi:ATP-binding cassette, subfamily B, bacterial MsbA
MRLTDRPTVEPQEPQTQGANRTGLAAVSDAAEMLRLVRRLISQAQGRLWFLPGMIVLAVLASVLEGMSLALLIPLIDALGGGGGDPQRGGLPALLERATALIPVQSKLLGVTIAILGTVIVKNAIGYTNAAVLGIASGRLSHALRTGVFTRIVDRPLAEFEADRSGRALNILNETWRVTEALKFLFIIVTSAMTIAVFVSILVFLSWRLSLIAFACIAVVVPLVHVIGVRAKEFGKQGLAETEMLSKRTWTALNGMRTIHTFCTENFEIERFKNSSEGVRSVVVKVALHTMLAAPITEIAITVVIAILLLSVPGDGLGIAAFAGFLAVLSRLQPRVLSLAAAHTNLLALHASVFAVSGHLEAAHVPTTAGKRPFDGVRNGISFAHVTFTYKGATNPALTDVSFRVPRGGMVAIVGASGAGKSTLLDLLLGFQRPQLGEIFVDDVALGEYDVSSWRAGLAVVDQDPYVFDDTVSANLRYGRPSASESEITEAARLACADEFIRALPGGYEAIIGERGTQLSGGQRQRIALARALLRKPDILILDEATNALDVATERAFQEALAAFAKQRTVIIVAHRLTSIEQVDHVVVLDCGRVVEEGAPAALLRTGRNFATNFGTQKNPIGVIGELAADRLSLPRSVA